jgi:hypothetical protein
MEVDQSLRSRAFYYQNRPQMNQFGNKRLPSQQIPQLNKFQRIFLMNNLLRNLIKIRKILMINPMRVLKETKLNLKMNLKHSSSLPYFEYGMKNGRSLKILVDTGSNKNYIQKRYIKNPISNQKPFHVNSVSGNIQITHHSFLNLFNIQCEKLKKILLPELTTFDGNDSFKALSAIIYTNENYMFIKKNIAISLKQHISNSVNNIKVRNLHMNSEQQRKLNDLIKNCPNLFSDPEEKLTYATSVKGEIRTTSDEPVYSKSYPYPMCLKKEVLEQVSKMLSDGIIRPSKSPYNSPVWIVPKKIDHSEEKKIQNGHRLSQTKFNHNTGSISNT